MPRRAPILLAFAAFGAFWGAWGVLLPDVKEATGASVSGLGLALLAIGLAALPAMLVTGVVTDRLGGRVVAPALLLFGLAALLPGFAGSVPALAAALALLGACSGALDVAINVAASSWEASAGARLMQVAHALFSAGFLAGAVGAGLAREAGSGALAVLAGCCGLLALSAWTNRGAPVAGAAPTRRRSLRFSPVLLALGALCAVAFVVESGIENWSALFLETELGASPGLAALGPGFFAAAMVAGRTVGQGLEARLGDRLLLAGGAGISALGLTVAALAPSLPVAVVGFGLGGIGISVAAPTLFGAGGRSVGGEDRGSAVASVTTVAYLGFLSGPPLIGGVSGALDLRAGVLLLAGIALLVAVATASFGGALPLRRVQHPPRRELP